MGLGDEIMALGLAQMFASPGTKVGILDAQGRRRWSSVWNDQSPIVEPGVKADMLITNGANARPYIKEWKSWNNQPVSVFTTWRVRDYPATLSLRSTETEKVHKYYEKTGPYVVVNPNLMKASSQNKQWPLKYWQTLIDLMCEAGIKPIQLVLENSGYVHLEGALTYTVDSLEAGTAFMWHADAYIGHEGGQHHIAAAVSTKGVVMFGGFASPLSTGYLLHTNLVGGVVKACGRWAKCSHCKNAMNKITPTQVFESLSIILKGAK